MQPHSVSEFLRLPGSLNILTTRQTETFLIRLPMLVPELSQITNNNILILLFYYFTIIVMQYFNKCIFNFYHNTTIFEDDNICTCKMIV